MFVGVEFPALGCGPPPADDPLTWLGLRLWWHWAAIVGTAALEAVAESLYTNMVPGMWAKKAYPSLKPLASWFRDLSTRVETFSTWIATAMPKVFWIPAFTYPSGYNTALLQTSARKNGIAIDTLSTRMQAGVHWREACFGATREVDRADPSASTERRDILANSSLLSRMVMTRAVPTIVPTLAPSV